jgi:transposase-like protein
MDSREPDSSGPSFGRRASAANREAALRLLRDSRHSAGLHCPHCCCRRVHRWGIRAGRRRYRCTACRRTFSDFTGTPLAYNKCIDLIPAYCTALLEGQTIRAAAATCGIHSTTAFRWRHRLIGRLREDAPPTPTGVLEATEIRFLHSMKGSRSLDRPAHVRGARGFAADRPRNWVLLVRDRCGVTTAQATGGRPPLVSQLAQLLAPPASGITELVAAAGPASPYAVFCRRHAIVFHTAQQWRSGGSEFKIANAMASARRLLGWMKRFRGVASRYLDNYLRWHTLVDETNRNELERLIAPTRSRSLDGRSPPGGGQPFARTERYGRGGRWWRPENVER